MQFVVQLAQKMMLQRRWVAAAQGEDGRDVFNHAYVLFAPRERMAEELHLTNV
jgi:hypothetical protein